MESKVELLEQRRLLSETWQTVDDYQYPPVSEHARTALTVDGSGRVYAAAAFETWDAGANAAVVHEVVKTSADGGSTWSVVSDDVPAGSRLTYINDIEVDAAGRLFVAGTYFPEGTSEGNYWFVRRSTDGGQTWSTVDAPAPAGWVRNEARDLAVDPAGAVYAVGTEGSATYTQRWVVRRSTDGGDTWSTVDSFSQNGDGGASGVFAHPTAGVFVVGTTRGGGTKGDLNKWVVRRSRDNGSTWASVDNYQLNKSYPAGGRGLGADAAGNLYAVGSASDRRRGELNQRPHWVVRKSTNGGATWTTVEDYQPAPNQAAWASRLVKDSAGNLYVAGGRSVPTSDGTTSTYRWVVRRNPGGTGAWSTVDEFSLGDGVAEPTGTAVDASGRVFVSGTAEPTLGSHNHSIVRRFAPANSTEAATFSSTQISPNGTWRSDEPTLVEELLA